MSKPFIPRSGQVLLARPNFEEICGGREENLGGEIPNSKLQIPNSFEF